MEAVRALVLLGLAGCSVPDVSLEGKSCPCASGYQCGTDMKCHAMPGDGGKRDVPGGASCLGTAAGAGLLLEEFDGALTFTTSGGTWTQSGGQLVQTLASSGLAFAYTSNSAENLGTYRVVTTVTGMTPGTSMGIAVRVNGGKQQYDCLWEPGSAGLLLWQSVNNGGQATTLSTSSPVATSSSVTMEVLAAGNTLQCCIDNIAGATLTVNNPTPSYPTGQPGVVVTDMHAAFDYLHVYAN
jgi:hypothetical protein